MNSRVIAASCLLLLARAGVARPDAKRDKPMECPMHAAHQAAAAPAAGTAGPRVDAASPYAGEQARSIKALSDDEVAGYVEGRGMGLARPAELNHYPGPRHVLDLAGPLGLSEAQVAETRRTFEAMHAEALLLGRDLVAQERRLDEAFASGRIDEPTLASLVAEAGRLQGQLRVVHLRAHLAVRRTLSAEQIARYDALRGYGAGHGDHGPGHTH